MKTITVEFRGTKYPAKIDEDGITCLLLSGNSITPVPLSECKIIEPHTDDEWQDDKPHRKIPKAK